MQEPAVRTPAMRTNWPSSALPSRLSFVESRLRIRRLPLEKTQIIRSELDKDNSHCPQRFHTQEQKLRYASIGGAITENFCHCDLKQIQLWGIAMTALVAWCSFNGR